MSTYDETALIGRRHASIYDLAAAMGMRGILADSLTIDGWTEIGGIRCVQVAAHEVKRTSDGQPIIIRDEIQTRPVEITITVVRVYPEEGP